MTPRRQTITGATLTTPTGSLSKSPRQSGRTRHSRQSQSCRLPVSRHIDLAGAETSDSGALVPANDASAVSPSPPAVGKHRSFFRQFSIRGLRSNVRQLFKQHSDELELSNNSGACSAELSTDGCAARTSSARKAATASPVSRTDCVRGSKARTTKMVVECRHEGVVRHLVSTVDGSPQNWEKCRLLLVRTIGGYLLEFYIPPKVTYCFLCTDCIKERHSCFIFMSVCPVWASN